MKRFWFSLMVAAVYDVKCLPPRLDSRHTRYNNIQLSPQLWKLARSRDSNFEPYDLESSVLPPELRIPKGYKLSKKSVSVQDSILIHFDF